MRLARFNIQTHVADKRYFIGLPIPAAAGTIAALVLATPERLVSRVWTAGLLAVTIVLSYLMISTSATGPSRTWTCTARARAWILPVIALAFAVVAYRPARAPRPRFHLRPVRARAPRAGSSLARKRRIGPVKSEALLS